MGKPLLITFSHIFMIKMENGIVISTKPIFYRIYIVDTYNRRKANVEASLFKAIGSGH